MKNLFLLLSVLFLTGTSLNAQSEEFGVASYYADAFDGRKTASAEVYNKNGMTAAHKELPFGTMIRVTRLDNNRSVVVRVNDRGPFISGRIVELSKAAAQKIGLIRDGIAEVKVEVVEKREPQEEMTAKAAEPAAAPTPKEVPPAFEKESTQPVVVVPENVTVVREDLSAPAVKKAAPAPKKAAPKAKPVAKKTGSAKLLQNPKDNGLYQIQLTKPDRKGYGVQVAYMTDYENVFRQVTELQAKWFDNILVSVSGSGSATKYRILLGPFPTQDKAEAYKSSLAKRKSIKGFVVDLSSL